MDRRGGVGPRHLDADCRAKPAGPEDHRKLRSGVGDGVAGAGVRVLHLRSHRRDVRGPARQAAAPVSHPNLAHGVGVHAGRADGDGRHSAVDDHRVGFHFGRALEFRSACACRLVASAGASRRSDQRYFSPDAGLQCGFHRRSTVRRNSGIGGRPGGRFRLEWMQLSGGDRLSFVVASGTDKIARRHHPALRKHGRLCGRCWL